jgi:vacuolar-type H+-ATPase subunit I/STV1
MDIAYKLFLTLHFIGLAGLLGGLLAQIPNKPKKLQPFVLHSAWLMLIAGVAMVAINRIMHADDATVELLNHVPVSIKSTLILVILVLGYLNVKKAVLSTKIWGVMTVLAIANIVVAVFI